jgi:hypothetical protein
MGAPDPDSDMGFKNTFHATLNAFAVSLILRDFMAASFVSCR